MDPIVLGKKLRYFREQCGLTQEEVEKAVGLPQKALSFIERGARKVSTFELSKCSELFRVPIGDFFSQEEDLLVALHRVAPGLDDTNVRDQVGKCIQICKEGVFLKEALGLSPQHTTRTYSYPAPHDAREAIKQGEAVAREERRALELGDAPIYDIADVFSSLGIWTVQTALPNEMSGLFLNHPSSGMVIVVNAKHAHARQRFSYAHEYAHALFDASRTIAISNTDNSGDLIEMRANAFASAFLMPEQGIAKILRSVGKGEGSRVELTVYDASSQTVTDAKHRQMASSQRITSYLVARMAHHFGVSYQAIVYRLQNLGFLRGKDRQTLLNEEYKGKEYLRILRCNEDRDVAKSPNRELKAEIAYLAMEAFSREKISRGRLLDLSKLLELSGKELLQLAENAL